ncbi:and TPR repeat-containing protein 4 [Seminavis robusta]|uniref:And TPR repeat-containing protein 4 n=1 Tax=Seminavis robusta TaxID=568900 RepID=A0A9N8E8A6_9STRA|nr:and TPR repeat-containing protein 4 [Seminavis robusta]|eukprot:Sro779_g201370.1 and TPR repeat-containing protein 4 (728) ;mRNA; f:39341-41709
MLGVLWNILKRPSLWTTIVALAAYWDHQALRGKWIYDDAGSVAKNVVVNGQVPWKDAFTRDFWGTPMKEPQSHKSFRPITTLSFKANWMLADYLGTADTEEHTHYFHVVNVLLHGINSGLVTEAAAFVFDDPAVLGGTSDGDILAQLITGFIFGLHPVHAESVSNITSRGELLMTFFFLVAFLSFASHLPARNTPSPKGAGGMMQSILCVYIIPWVGMTASLFSKEQGATTLCALVAYDFLKHHTSAQEYFSKLLFQRDSYSLRFLGRTVVLAIQTILMAGWRKWLNGESSPDFIYDQNPAGFAEHRFTRAFSLNWVYCLYIRDMIFPVYLAPDWSGVSIDLIEDISDHRALLVIFLWIFAFACVQSLFVGLPEHATILESEVRRVLLMAFFAFLFLPFLLSSHLLVVGGFMKADRVVYLPLFGFCIMEALLVKTLCCSYILEPAQTSPPVTAAKPNTTNESTTKGKSDPPPELKSESEAKKEPAPESENEPSAEGKLDSAEDKDKDLSTTTNSDNGKQKSEQAPKKPVTKSRLRVNLLGQLLCLIQIGLFSVKLHERNIAWSSPVILWTKAFNVNPRSHHTMYNCGYELSLRQRYAEAEEVMRPIGNARVDGPSNTFVYAMVLYNLGRCDDAHYYIDIAMDVLEEQRIEGGIRHQSSALDRTKSNLLVARGYCTTENFQKQGRILQEAVRTDPRNTYAVQQFQAYLNKMEQIKEMKEKYGMDVPGM